MRPKRGPKDVVTEFQDPLKNYDPPIYEDALQRSLAEDTVDVIQIRPFETVPPTMTVKEAMQMMVDLDIACLMIVENDRLIGVFSERNVLDNVAPDYEAVKGKPIRAVMTKDPASVHITDNVGKAVNLMAVSGFRHVPILDVDEKVTGIVGPRRVTAYLQKYFLQKD
ncbi:MAG: CBS domain-containing protein [Planctomycetota bacterium]|nr:CBS domain-containing protein [Planctomycetota bacterium]